MPTSTHEDEEVEEFYEEVSKIMSENKSYYKIVKGDFNAKVGGHQQGDGAAVGQYGYGERNERGTTLVQFATSENLTISNTCLRKRRGDDQVVAEMIRGGDEIALRKIQELFNAVLRTETVPKE